MNRDRAWHTQSAADVLTHFNANTQHGLSVDQAAERLRTYGSNSIDTTHSASFVARLGAQVKNPLVLVLIAAALVTLFLGEYLDAVVVLAALCVNVGIGLFQEGKAENIFKTLAQKLEHEATVVRAGTTRVVPAHEVVPGDIVVLSAGSAIVADARIIECKDLATNEASLTGEWASVTKNTTPINQSTPVAERTNMVFAGTHVAVGDGKAVVVATGAHTEFGSIAEGVQQQSEPTPLQQEIARVAHLLLVVIGVALVCIFALGLFRGAPVGEMLLLAIAIAVAAMPEGLPAAVSVTLALGMERLLKAGGLVKSLLAAETLGSTTVILTDKTGTLTKGEMELKGLYTAWGMRTHSAVAEDDNAELLTMAVLASDAFVNGVDPKGTPIVEGRPIEKAIVEAGLQSHITQDDLFIHRDSRIDFASFDPRRRYALSLNEREGEHNRLYLTGAPEYLLDAAEFVYDRGVAVPITTTHRSAFSDVQQELSKRGMRFTAVAYIDTDEEYIHESFKEPGEIKNIVFAGLLSFADAVRQDVPASIDEVTNAGVRVIMATGDNVHTAQAVAEEVGIPTKNTSLEGKDIEHLTDEQLYEALMRTHVLARVLPEQKKRLATVLQARGHVVAMTGDGVNDAPALVTADIGVAVGSGTDAAKSAADLILVHNSFAVIVQAVKEGRRIMENLRRIMAYLLSTSFSEVILFGGALFVGGPLPALPAQVLWANMIEEGLLSVPLALEPAGKDVMRHPPKPRGQNPLLTRALFYFTIAVSAITGGILFAVYSVLRSFGVGEQEIQTVVFVALSIDSIFFSLSFKNLYVPVWRINWFSNPPLVYALFGSFALLAVVLWVPLFAQLLSLTHITGYEVLLLIGVGLANLAGVELAKKALFKH